MEGYRTKMLARLRCNRFRLEIRKTSPRDSIRVLQQATQRKVGMSIVEDLNMDNQAHHFISFGVESSALIAAEMEEQRKAL